MDAGREYDVRAARIVHSSDLNRLLGFIETREVPYEEVRARIDPDDLQRLSQTVLASLHEGEPHFQSEVRYRLSRGEVRWLLVHELNHRVKNTLAVVQALAHQSFAGGRDLVRRQAFEGRLVALASAHNLLTSESWEAASLGDVIRSAAAPCDPEGSPLTLDGPDMRVPPKTAVALALAVHELCTNAVKYGALSTNSGRATVAWSVAGDRMRLVWIETGGPPVVPPRRRGFGSRMLEGALAGELAGSVALDFAPAGLCCTIDAPASKDWFIAG